ncbi:hypothetical protein F0L68_33345 [Solihabitans fulvus]|uniref:Uncharacterized protein n=1 Tax=Solihabitans fulvus TaxID=1892852 RepID=A0A5B2WQQ6_9PSEU|nr:hypothetical protein [Solihabitans fulvus]KAA2253298.1 hypothetical protein F0L68_33345 [Solihabitans fulvus]
MDSIVLGTGILRWQRYERQTDRYGTVNLDRAPYGESVDLTPFDTAPVGTRGRLVAVIVDTRRSPHCGDLARGITPTTPQAGEEITLGTGTLFVQEFDHGSTEIGLAPDDDRYEDWLDPQALYRCHSQTVRLELRSDESVPVRPFTVLDAVSALPAPTYGHDAEHRIDPGRHRAMPTSSSTPRQRHLRQVPPRPVPVGHQLGQLRTAACSFNPPHRA